MTVSGSAGSELQSLAHERTWEDWMTIYSLRRLWTARPRARLLLIALLWAVLSALLFWEFLLAPADRIAGGNDLSQMFWPWFDYARDLIRSGGLPLWNPYFFAGTSFVGDPQPALFYPPTWLALVLPVTRAIGWLLALHVWWMAVGATGWLRSTGATWWGAIGGAAVLAFSGYTFARVQAGHLGVIAVGAWLPWALWALRRLVSPANRRRTLALGALSVGMAFLAGHTATFFYVSFVLAAYALYLALGRGAGGRYLGSAALMGVLGVLLGAIQLFPSLQLILGSSRVEAADYSFASRFSWPIGYLLTLLIPNFFGEPVRTGYWGEELYDELIFYVGVLPLALTLLTVQLRRSRFWVAVAGFSLLLAFGSYGILHRLFFRLVPLFSAMRAPARAGFVFVCAAAALVALALTYLERSEPADRRQWLRPIGPALIGAVLGAVTLIVVGGYMAFAWGREANPAAGRLYHVAGQVAAFGLFFALAVVWLRSWRSEMPSPWLPALGVGLILLDLWTFGAGLVRTVPAEPDAFWRIVAEHTRGATGRVLPWGLGVFEQNGALSFRVRSVFGYNPLEDQAYNAFVSAVPDPRARAYDLLNARYVVSKQPLELVAGDTLQLLAEDSGAYIYERSTVLPPAWAVTRLATFTPDQLLAQLNDPTFDPRTIAVVTPGTKCVEASGQPPGEVEIIDYAENRMVARTAGSGGLVIFSERDAPGWQATLDGKEAPLLRVDGVLRGVCVPAGTHVIQMEYRPSVVLWGGGVTGAALLAIVALGVWTDRPRRRSRRAMTSR
jgi:hypothetical protein